jgi:hypothetical protein
MNLHLNRLYYVAQEIHVLCRPTRYELFSIATLFADSIRPYRFIHFQGEPDTKPIETVNSWI